MRVCLHVKSREVLMCVCVFRNLSEHVGNILTGPV